MQVRELDRENRVADQVGRQHLIHREPRELGGHPLGEDRPRGLDVPGGAADDGVREPHRQHLGVVLHPLLDERQQICMPTRERADHEDLAYEDRERIGFQDLLSGLEGRRRECLGIFEPSLHRRLERVEHPDQPRESWRTALDRKLAHSLQRPRRGYGIGQLDRDVERHVLHDELERGITGTRGRDNRSLGDVGSQRGAFGPGQRVHRR